MKMTKERKMQLIEWLEDEFELLQSFDLGHNGDLLIAAAACMELSEYLSVRDGLIEAARCRGRGV